MTGTLRERAIQAALDKAWSDGPWDMTKLEATGITDAVLAVAADVEGIERTLMRTHDYSCPQCHIQAEAVAAHILGRQA